MRNKRLGACACSLALLLAALLGCKREAEPRRDQSGTTATSTTPSAPAPPAAPSASPLARDPAAERPLAELFAGAASGVELGKRVKGALDGTWHVSVPNGWSADTEQYHGMVVLTSGDKTARMFMSDGIGAATDKNMDFWVSGGFGHVAEITWDKPAVDGKLGPNQRKARINTGRGKLFKQPASFWAIRPEDKAAGVLVEGGVVDGAPAERKRELLAAMQSVEEK